MLKEAKRQCR